MFSKSGSIALVILAFSASTTSTPVSASDSYLCGSPITTYVTVTPSVSSMIGSGILTASISTQSILQSNGSISPVPIVSSSLSPAPLSPVLDCHQNNCLRKFIKVPEIPAFCATYTTAINTVTTGLPAYVSMCDANPSEISSACSCLPTTTVSIIPTPTPPDCHQNNCLRQFMNPTNIQVTRFCYTYTTTTNSATVLPTFVDMCDSDPNQISSTCSCTVMLSVSSIPPSPSASSPSSSPSASLPSSSDVGPIISGKSTNLTSQRKTTTPDGIFASAPGSTEMTSLSSSTSLASNAFGSPSSTISATSSSVCASSSVIVQTTTMVVFITVTATLLPSSANSASSG